MSVRGHESRPAGPGSAGAPLPAHRNGEDGTRGEARQEWPGVRPRASTADA